jgi:hypothetical protein
MTLKTLAALDVTLRLRAHAFNAVTPHTPLRLTFFQVGNSKVSFIIRHILGRALAGTEHQHQDNRRNNRQENGIALTRPP